MGWKEEKNVKEKDATEFTELDLLSSQFWVLPVSENQVHLLLAPKAILGETSVGWKGKVD